MKEEVYTERTMTVEQQMRGFRAETDVKCPQLNSIFLVLTVDGEIEPFSYTGVQDRVSR